MVTMVSFIASSRFRRLRALQIGRILITRSIGGNSGYIVQNTLGPLVDERRAALEDKLAEIRRTDDSLKRARKSEEYRASERRGARPLETLLDVKVLDPAMGSGHFLVAAVDYLTDEFVGVIRELDDGPVLEEIGELRGEIEGSLRQYGVSVSDEQLSDANLLKRMVMKRCVYGVDLNEMAVELAKLSLWLDAFTVGAPLSFLDHHLKHGNSLIGSSVREVQREIESSGSLFGNQFVSTLNQGTELMRYVGEIADATEWEVRESFDAYERADRVLRPYKRMLDLWTSQHFGNAGAQKFLSTAASNVDVDHLIEGDYDHFEADDREIIDAALRLSAAKDFFHWELEFPEVFFDENARHKENPGFDAVVGNPPYVSVTNIEKAERQYVLKGYATAKGRFDLYIVFVEKGLQLTRFGGLFGYIVPIKFAIYGNGSILRTLLLNETSVKNLVNVSQARVFDDPSTYPCVLVVKNGASEADSEIVVSNVRETGYEAFKRDVDHNSFALPYERINKMPEHVMSPAMDETHWSLFEHANRGSDHLSTLCLVEQCIRIGSARVRSKLIVENASEVSPSLRHLLHPTLDGENLRKYHVNWEEKYLVYYKDELYNPKRSEVLDVPKILLKRIAPSLQCYPDVSDFYYPLNTIYALVPLEESKVSLFYLSALLNGKLLDKLYKILFEAIGIQGGYIEFREYVQYLPISRISFTTPEPERQDAVEEATGFYEAGEHTAVVWWAERELDWTPEAGQSGGGRNDTVHDLLSNLAERMTAMHKERVESERAWREWVEAAVPNAHKLTKTFRQQGWVEVGCRDGWEGVRAEFQARKAVPDSPKDLQNLRKNTEEALRELCPLRERIEATDRLIDQIVYRLYGLTEEEISVVEGSVGPG